MDGYYALATVRLRPMQLVQRGRVDGTAVAVLAGAPPTTPDRWIVDVLPTLGVVRRILRHLAHKGRVDLFAQQQSRATPGG